MHKMLIGADWVSARDGRTLPVVNPSNGTSFDEIPRGTAHEVDLAVKAARQAQQGPWGQMTSTERGRLLCRIGQAVLDHEDELAQIEAKDTGKPLTTARNDIKVLELATGQVRQLTFGEGTNESPSFSPNGRHVMFFTTRGSGKSQIAVVDIDGKNVRILTKDGENSFPNWSGFLK